MARRAELRTHRQRLALLTELRGWIETREGYGKGGGVDRVGARVAERIAEERQAIQQVEDGVLSVPKELDAGAPDEDS